MTTGTPAEPQSGQSDPTKGAGVELTMTQERLATLMAREKDQGARTAMKQLTDRLGFADTATLEQYVQATRKAQTDDLSEAQYREVQLAEREKAIHAREAAAIARERSAIRRAHLARAGATGTDLEDAMALLRADDEADEADDDQLAEAVQQLTSRRPELFTAPGSHRMAPAPGGAPASVPPPHTPAPTHTPGAAGLEMARRRGLLPPAN
ncbi:hypothetical protein ACQEVX_05010 [Streptomyces syringium]|uniref:hypothetical protein n=1 Tax=Streptomyces syringium TaxID=76729 RepID=UPI003D91AEA3